MLVPTPRNYFPLKDSGSPTILLAASGSRRSLQWPGPSAVRARPLNSLICAEPKPCSTTEDLRGDHQPRKFETPLRRSNRNPTRHQGLIVNKAQWGTSLLLRPPGFMAAVARAWEHWPDGSVHFEAFQLPVRDDTQSEPFTMVLRNGTAVPVPADKSALVAFRATGVLLMASCENGVCGTCECRYLEGVSIHLDAVLLNDARSNRFIPCVSRATGVLKLDL